MIDNAALRQEINRLVLHPLGLVLGDFECRPAPFDVYIHEPDAEAARRVADEIEACGPARQEALGHIIQPLPPEVKQLHVTVRETVPLP